MYGAVGGLRHLLHGLTVVGVAAAHNANRQDAYIALLNASIVLEADLSGARRAQTTAQAKVDALQYKLLREHSEAQARELVLAVRVLKHAHANVTKCKAAIKRNYARLARVQSELDAIRGALLRDCHPVVWSRLAHFSCVRLLQSYSTLLPPLCAALAQGMACCVYSSASRVC